MRWLLKWTFLLVMFVLVIAALVLAGFRIAANFREDQVAETVAPAGGRYVEGDDVKIFLQERGPADGQLVVFVHGTGAWSGAWIESLDRLGKAGYHAVAIDLPPFGYSQRPAAPSYDKLAQGARIAAVLVSLGEKPAILVGHSFGAGPAMEAAMAKPKLVRGIVVVDPALSIEEGVGPPIGSRRSVPPERRAVFAISGVRDALVATFLTNPMMTRKLLQGFIDDPSRATDPWVEIYRKPQVVRGTTPALGDWLPQLAAPTLVERSEVAASYSSLGIPLEAIWGERDNITPIDQGERLVKLVPGARLNKMPGIGHIPQIEDNARFNDELEAAVTRLMQANK